MDYAAYPSRTGAQQRLSAVGPPTDNLMHSKRLPHLLKNLSLPEALDYAQGMFNSVSTDAGCGPKVGA